MTQHCARTGKIQNQSGDFSFQLHHQLLLPCLKLLATYDAGNLRAKEAPEKFNGTVTSAKFEPPVLTAAWRRN